MGTSYDLPEKLKKNSKTTSNLLIEGPGEKKREISKQAVLLRVAESNRNFYIFLSQACMKCPLQGCHHESYSNSLAVKIV